MLFFHKRWWLKKKKFPNRRTVLASAWSDRCGVTSRRFWPAVYWKKSDPMFIFSGENHLCQCPMSSFKEKRREILEYCCSRERGTSWSRKLSSLRPRIRVFFLKGLLSGAINSILGTMISLAFSIFLDMKISGVTLFGGMADWRNDGTEWWNTGNILKYGIYGML